MQVPQRKNRKTNQKGFKILALLMTLALAISAGALYYVKQQEAIPYQSTLVDTGATLKQATPNDISLIQVSLKNHENYTLINKNGQLWLDGETEAIDSFMAEAVFKCFSPLYVEETLTDNPDDYLGYLDEFGLDEPTLILNVTYTDGQKQTLTIGDQAPETVQRYFTVSGDNHLYLCPNTLYDAFYFDYRLFHTVNQPVLSPTRINHITVQDGSGKTVFAYEIAKGYTYREGDDLKTIQNSFFLSQPATYPVDSEWITPILSALNNFVLGPRHAQDTPENRAIYGLEPPKYTLTVHQRAGIDTQTDATGQVTRVAMPEATYVFEIGDMNSDVTRYVASNGWIHLFNSFQLSFVYDLDPLSTLTKNPVNLPMNLVKSLEDGDDVYVITRTESFTEDGNVKTDLDGNTLYDTTVTKNGTPYDVEVFENRYEALKGMTVSGRLPEDFTPNGQILKSLKLNLTTGESRVITLMPFDAMHNAVGIDGVYLFYIIKGGLTF